MPPQIFLLVPKIVSLPPPPQSAPPLTVQSLCRGQGSLYLQQLGFKQQPPALAGGVLVGASMGGKQPLLGASSPLSEAGGSGCLQSSVSALHSLPRSPMEISLSGRVRHLDTQSSRKPPSLALLRSEG